MKLFIRYSASCLDFLNIRLIHTKIIEMGNYLWECKTKTVIGITLNVVLNPSLLGWSIQPSLAGGPVVRVLLCMHHWEQLVAQRKGTAPIISSLGLGFANLCPHLCSPFGRLSVNQKSVKMSVWQWFLIAILSSVSPFKKIFHFHFSFFLNSVKMSAW